MATTYVTSERDAVVSEVLIQAPPDRIFRALTERDQALQWGSSEEFVLTKWEMEARLGGRWTFIAKQAAAEGEYAGIELIHHGEIVEFEPPRVLAYTWFASWHSNPLHETVVRWELSPAPGGTQVKVTHSGLAPMPEDCKGYAQGWPGLVTRVKQFVEGNSR